MSMRVATTDLGETAPEPYSSPCMETCWGFCIPARGSCRRPSKPRRVGFDSLGMLQFLPGAADPLCCHLLPAARTRPLPNPATSRLTGHRSDCARRQRTAPAPGGQTRRHHPPPASSALPPWGRWVAWWNKKARTWRAAVEREGVIFSGMLRLLPPGIRG